MIFFSNRNSYNAVGMDIPCRSFGIPFPKEEMITGNTVSRAYTEENIPEEEDYLMQDVEASHQLFEKIKQYLP